VKETLKRIADIFFTIAFSASLSGCASVLEYWTLDNSGNPVLSAEGGAAVVEDTVGRTGNTGDTGGENNAELSGGETSVLETEDTVEAVVPTESGVVNAPTWTDAQIQELQRAADEARQAQKDAENERDAARKRIAELEAAATVPPAMGADAQIQELQHAADEARQDAANAEAARQKAEAGLATRAQPAAVVEITPPAAAETRPAESNTVQAAPPAYFTVNDRRVNCFWRIAELVYGDPSRWPIIYEANRDKLEDPNNPDLLKEGVVLKIPPIP
jgi:nucleoid-associated protein YgaU